MNKMKIFTILLVILIITLISLVSCNNQKKVNTTQTKKQNIYQFKVKTLNNETFDFTTLKGKKILIVNTASKCGLTPQYKDLQILYEKYNQNNFTIIGFPTNNFLWQEPGSNKDIEQFCTLNYGVTFPMMSKISVKGKDIHPVYKFLTQQAKNGLKDSKVSWNFQKYLINENGILEKVISPKTSPLADEITNWIKGGIIE